MSRSLALVVLAATLGGAAAGCGGGGSGSPSLPGLVDGPIVGRVTASSVTIAWRTGTPEIGAVDVGPDATYGRGAVEPAATTEHRVLHTGDIAYGAGTEQQVETRFLEPYEPLLDHIPLYASIGNHDAATGHGGPLLAALTLPTNDVDGGSLFYSFEWGAVHFVALDSNQPLAPGSAQLAWLDADLAASAAATFRVVFFHHPPYSSSKNGSHQAVRAALSPVLDRHRVDLVFNGHDHVYERTLPMADGEVAEPSPGPDYVDAPGTIYVVTGGGGQNLYPAGTSDFTAVSESAFHFVEVEVSGAALTATAIRLDGSVLDRFTLTQR
ncbi:MAG: metallophosphoesterase [Deltaproteobacteria bacterium]|nr:metallophosphoesterase [Deltaproteobacteria bacterium]